MASSRRDRLLEVLWPTSRNPPTGEVYALLDTARDPRIYHLLRRSLMDYQCLYSGKLSREMEEVAPYLVALGRNSPLTADLINLGWGNSWGYFVSSSAILQDLRRHFRRFLRVQDEGGDTLLFRYYDPRVWRVYLPTCHADELRFVFGPVDRYLVEGGTPDSLIEFRRSGHELVQSAVDLSRGVSPRLS